MTDTHKTTPVETKVGKIVVELAFDPKSHSIFEDLISELAPSQGETASRAFGLALSLFSHVKDTKSPDECVMCFGSGKDVGVRHEPCDYCAGSGFTAPAGWKIEKISPDADKAESGPPAIKPRHVPDGFDVQYVGPEKVYKKHPAIRVSHEAQKADHSGGVTEMIDAINNLREDEGDSITIACDNPDAGSNDMLMYIECSGHWTDWKPRHFYGPDVMSCLRLAMDAKHNGPQS